MTDRFLSMQLFVRVARTGSFSLAGREIGLSQPSASRIVAAFEKHVGVKLLRRTTHGVKLTDAGADYLIRADAILAAVDEADHAAKGGRELRGTLRIACSSAFATRSILPCLSPFTDAHPKLSIEFLLGDHRHNIIEEGVDIACRVGAPINPNTVVRQIGENHRLLAAAPSYLERAGVPRNPDELLKHTLIFGPASKNAEGWTFTKAGRTRVLRVEGRFVIDTTEASTAAAVNGLGIISTGELGCRQELQHGTLVRVLPDWTMGSAGVYLVFPDGRAAKPSAHAFADFFGTHFEKLADQSTFALPQDLLSR